MLIKKVVTYNPPSWLIFLNAALFVTMSSVSILQHTIFLRNFTLIFGALIGAFLIFKNRQVFNLKNSKPLIALSLLFVWVLAHYFLFSSNPEAQLQEISSVWKRVFLSFIFAIGLGLSIQSAGKISKLLVLGGFAASVIVFYFRWIINSLGISADSQFFTLNYFDVDADGYIPKYYFSTFVVPFIAIAYCFLTEVMMRKDRFRFFLMLATCLTLIASLYIFYAIHNKNGVLYFLIISIVFVLYSILKRRKEASLKSYIMLALFLLSLSPLIYTHIKTQPTWSTFVVDSIAAFDFEKNDQWQYDGAEKGLPLNKLSTTVSGTTYLRVAWAVKGSELLVEYPLGYGLVINSFGPLAKLKWPNSKLTHSHSGWLDLGLAFGIPGLLLILIALITAVSQCSKTSKFIPKSGVWVLLSVALVFITSEVAERVLFDYLIFLIAFFSSSSINAD
jgi:hypothetical protein